MLSTKAVFWIRKWLAEQVFTTGDEENGLPIVAIMIVSVAIMVIASLLPGCRSAVAMTNQTEYASTDVEIDRVR